MVAPVRITIPWGGLPTGNPWGPIFCPVVSAGTAMPLALPGMAGTDRFPARLPGCLTRNHGATEDLRGPDHMRAPPSRPGEGGTGAGIGMGVGIGMEARIDVPIDLLDPQFAKPTVAEVFGKGVSGGIHGYH